MRLDRPPYWFWGLDRWNIAVTAVLLVAFVVSAASGLARRHLSVLAHDHPAGAGARLTTLRRARSSGKTAQGRPCACMTATRWSVRLPPTRRATTASRCRPLSPDLTPSPRVCLERRRESDRRL